MKISRAVAKRVGNKTGIDWTKVSLSQFTMGMNVELEHRGATRGNLIMTGRIVLDHLMEIPNYYTRLARMEKRR